MRKILNLLLIFNIIQVYSQLSTPEPAPNGFMNTLMVADSKEPSVARFQEYSFVPVNLYAGKAKIEIPFFELKLDGLTIPISLEYNTQGIQINSVASRVGTGWVLNAGGNIGRSIKEVNDFHFVARRFPIMPIGCESTKGHPLRVGWKYRNSNVCISTSPVYPQLGPDNIDISPDVFTASAPGLLTQFYYPNSEMEIGPFTEKLENTSPIEIEPTDSKFSSTIKELRITYPTNVPTFLQSIPDDKRFLRDYFDFNITHNGYQYSFNDYDLSYLDSPNSFYATEPFGGINHQELNWDISAWHINKIENVNTNKKVNFIYESSPYYVTSQLLYKYFLDRPEYGDDYIKPPNYNNINETTIYLNPKRIKAITSDEATVMFQYNHARKDLLGDQALTNIQIYNTNGQMIKEYRLNYYYMNDNFDDGPNKRLYLDYVEEFGAENKLVGKYYLSYFDGSLPGSNTSNQSDWYGYYKKNTTGGDRPILFMNRNLKQFSILPIQLQVPEVFSLRGNRSIYPDENDMKVGMLRKITYPTGGYTKLDYEANRFRLNNQEILGGGLRILAQDLSDLNNVRTLKYTYKEQDGLTSGYVNNVPSYGYSAGYKSLDNLSYNEKVTFIGETFFTMLRSLVSVDRTQNTYVGYAEVREEEQGKGYTTYQYSSPKEYPSTLPVMSTDRPMGILLRDNSAFPFLDIPINFDVRNGKIKLKKTYSSTNTLLNEESYEYSYKILDAISLNKRRYIPSMDYYKGYTISGGISSHRNLLTKKHTWNYPSANNAIENIESYDYEPILPLTKKATLISGQNTSFTNFYYPKDILALGQQTTEMQQLIDQKRNSEIIKTESFKNTIKQGEKIVKYGSTQDTDGKLQPIASYQSRDVINTAVDTDKIFSIDKYDSKGHILQITDKSKEPTAIIWGYNQTLPIAKIVGVTYGQVSGNISDIVTKSNADIDQASEQLLNDALDTFRKSYSPTYLVTTYTYDPLIGMTSTTDPSGFKKYYKYDHTNRLEKILDKDNNIIEEYKYNYAPSRFYNKRQERKIFKNDCPSWQLGTAYTYVVPEDTYFSYDNIETANQMAIAEIDQKGQQAANQNGSCEFLSCQLTPNYYVTLQGYNSIQQTQPNHIEVILVFKADLTGLGMSYASGSGVSVGYIGANCRPNSVKVINQTNWTITIDTNGYVMIRSNNGTSPPNNTQVGVSFSYDK
ncbi:DUF5977 domain-containing protein [Epilithonimonas caeni]|uniref:DUF5977 domain-containing protein n=1 Tax=Epilithonimonas caeni TaxID=365343 RepID=UPI0012EB9512|nr:DUF5977 domain-containing protein [Epilithonimonas caeni]